MAQPRGLQALVDEHVARWQLAQRGERPARAPACAALSRWPGSRGGELGQKVAEALGCSFFGIELVDRIAREQNVQRSLLVGLDERVRRAIDRFVLEPARPVTEDDYLRHVVRTLHAILEHGDVVVLGRGAAFVLPQERTLRVLAVSPRAQRIERVAKSEDLTRDRAEARLDQLDEERRLFHRHHFQKDPDDPSHYHLVVNTAELGMEAAVELVVESWRRRFPPR